MDKFPRLPTDPNANPNPTINQYLKVNQSTPFTSSIGSSHHTLGQIADQFQDRNRAAHGNRDSATDDHNYDYDGDGGDDDNLMDYDEDPEGDALISHGNESTGRWTRSEHDLFLEALKKYGKEWKKVAAMVKTRTVVQTRTHAQKYFQKLSKVTGSSNSGISKSAHRDHDVMGDRSNNEHILYTNSSSLSSSIKKNNRVKYDPTLASPIINDFNQRMIALVQSSAHVPMLIPDQRYSSAFPGNNNSTSHILINHPYSNNDQGGSNESDNIEYYDQMDIASLLAGHLNKTPLHTKDYDAPSSSSLSGGPIPPPPHPDSSHQPSPAACGKRKHAELAAAQMLAATSASGSSTSKRSDPHQHNQQHQLQPLQQSRSNSSDKYSSNVNDNSATISRRNRLGLTLSINDPNDSYSDRDFMEPGTPWETAVMELENRQRQLSSMRSMRSLSFNSYAMAPVPMTTPSDQRSFFSKVRIAVMEGDLAGLTALLGAAEFSAQSYVDSKSSNNNMTNPHRSKQQQQLILSESPFQTSWKRENDSPEEEDEAITKLNEDELDTSFIDDNEPFHGLQRQDSYVSVSNLMSVYAPNVLTGRFTPPIITSESTTGPDDIDTACSDINPEPSPILSAPLSSDDPLSTNTAAGTVFRPDPVKLNKQSKSYSLVAESLNRTDHRGVSILMDVVATKPDISINIQYSMCTLLLEHGACPDLIDRSGNTCLHYAARMGNHQLGRLFLTKGCPMNVQNSDGDTALHIAARLGHSAFFEVLAELGANFHIRNGDSLSALDLLGSDSETFNRRDVLRRIMLTVEPRLRTLVLYHEDFLEHTARHPSDWEGPDRLEAIMKRLTNKSEFLDYEIEISNNFEKADVNLLGRVHSAEYIAFVNMLAKHVQDEENSNWDNSIKASKVVPFTPQVQRFLLRQTSEELKQPEHCDTSFSAGTLNAARRASGAVAHAVDRVMLGRNRNVFCAIRPPGHHAGYRGLLDGSKSCGFCIFNNVAAGALHALEHHNCGRVAIIDLDVHHGNGTEDIIRRYSHPSRLFFFSLHLYEKDHSSDSADSSTTTSVTTEIEVTLPQPDGKYEFYPGTGSKDDYVHNIINVPLTPLWALDHEISPHKDSSTKSTSSSHHSSSMLKNSIGGRLGYRQAIEQRLIPSLRAFNPSLILVSIGFDAAAGDVGNIRHFSGEHSKMGIDLTPEDFAWTTTEIMKIADICCGGRLISVLEGGYGEYSPGVSAKQSTKASNITAPTTRATIKKSADVSEPTKDKAAVSSSTSASTTTSGPTMNRSILAAAVSAHVRALIDPYARPLKTNT